MTTFSRTYPRHTHRFENLIARYDKEDGSCIIKLVLQDHEATFIDVTETTPASMVEGFASFIEDTQYFKDLENRI